MRDLITTILVSLLTLRMTKLETNKTRPNKNRIMLYVILGCALWILQIYEILI